MSFVPPTHSYAHKLLNERKIDFNSTQHWLGYEKAKITLI